MLKNTTVLGNAVNLSNTHSWNLGRNEEFPSSRIFNGYMDQVKVFEAPLSQDEIDSIITRERSLLKTDDKSFPKIPLTLKEFPRKMFPYIEKAISACPWYMSLPGLFLRSGFQRSDMSGFVGRDQFKEYRSDNDDGRKISIAPSYVQEYIQKLVTSLKCSTVRE
jgi:hypothetical protein